ncbi:hypothetical protein C5B42_04260 [Candidatus Cerribacteria bacterium 'Amazon FNV 2010 28 9']|uniref:Major facilitator superfamily (MFS) profile domain-containing protein n=1 Tax=Candidatus Cerribacteria bacterium 'Amazon FNV 2010 28 9' TaxID=2081795 RepID=A0A317JN89_9BACT|nr:MAG: hypothetical protein C5B42_04260 [Candidatus Cerribacteria bacterium 'Amazon FNV 2010 28 9']
MPHFLRHSQLRYDLFPPHLRLMFFGSLLRTLADLFVGTFAPLFLFGIGKNLPLFAPLHLTPFVAGMMLIALYYGAQRLSILLLSFPVAQVIARIGYVWSMVVGLLCLTVVFVSYHFASADPRFLIPAFLGGALDLLFFWTTHDAVFAREVNVKQIGRGVGALAFLTQMLQIAAPAVAGILIVTFGFTAVFLIGIACALLACIPFLLLPRFAMPSVPTPNDFFKQFKDPLFRQFSIGVVGKYMDTIAVLLWPVYILVIVGQIDRVGFFFSLVLFSTLILTYIAGWYVDHKRKGKAFYVSGVFVSCAWILRLFAQNVFALFGIEMMDKLASSFYSPCFDAYMCERSKGKRVYSFYFYREVIFSIVAVFLWSGIIGLFLLPVGWAAIFLFGAVGVLLSLAIERRA